MKLACRLITTAAAGSILLAASVSAQPEFIYETTIGGYSLPGGDRLCVTGDGYAYTVGQYQDRSADILVVKLDNDGGPLWTRTIQGAELDIATGMTVDSAGDVYLTGFTDSDDFPVRDAFKFTRTRRDAFIMKLSGDDGSIIFSTYFGGEFSDTGGDIAVNGAGEIYVTGYTESLDFPVTDNAIQSELNIFLGLASDAFVTKLSSDARTVLYSTYLGGTADDEAHDLGLDADGNIYIAGHTRSDDWPVVNAAQPDFGGGFADAFAARISADGNDLNYSTYLGGEDWDRLNGLAVDASGNAYLAGITHSLRFPTTSGAFQPNYAGEPLACGSPPFIPLYNCEEGYVTKFSPDGGVVFSTYLGGSNADECRDVAVDAAGGVVLVGYSSSVDFPGGTPGDGSVIFVSRLSADGSDLSYTVSVDSQYSNRGHGIAVDDSNAVYFSGAINFPADVYIAKLRQAQAGAPGDLNCDGAIDAFDIEPFLLALFDPAEYAGRYPRCDINLADVNGDGSINSFDIEPFLDLLFP